MDKLRRMICIRDVISVGDMRSAHKIISVKFENIRRCIRRVEDIIIVNTEDLKVLNGFRWLRIEPNGDLL
jgi:hypothetical protein